MTASLKMFQEMFAAQLLSTDVNYDFLETIKSNSCDEARVRLNVYCNNVLSSLIQALGDTYPVIKRLVGADCFNGVANDFVRSHPPHQASLHFYGEYFAEFIKNHHACEHLAYLSDVARLEWCYQRAVNANDADVISLAEVQTVNTEHLGDLCFTMHPSVYLLSSLWPIHVIWHENTQDKPATIDVSHHCEARLLIFRDKLNGTIINLEQKPFSFLQNIINGHSLENAWLMTDQPIAELGVQLSYLLALPLFVGYQLKLNE
jgi:hypothetical protein